MDERLSIDLSEYGKQTPEDVFVEFIQAICDDVPERLIHTLSPYGHLLVILKTIKLF